MSEFKQSFTTVKGISNQRRLPRLGKVRLGIKVLNKPEKINKERCKCDQPGNPGCPFCTHPKEVNYFVVPPEVEKKFGKEPKKLEIMFPINDREAVFPQAYKYYGHSIGLKCIGNGVVARRAQEDGTFAEIECPCEYLKSKRCALRAHLLFIIPSVNLGGIYQLDVGSYHSIVDVNSGIDYCRGIIKSALHIDRFAMIPLTLSREPRETHHGGKRQTHYTLNLYPNITLEDLRELEKDTRIILPPEVKLPAIVDESPGYDKGPVVSEEPPAEEESQDTPPAEEPPPKTESVAADKQEDFAAKKKMIEEFSEEYGKHLRILQKFSMAGTIPAMEYAKIVEECTRYGDDFPRKIQHLIQKIAEIKTRGTDASNKQDNQRQYSKK